MMRVVIPAVTVAALTAVAGCSSSVTTTSTPESTSNTPTPTPTSTPTSTSISTTSAQRQAGLYRDSQVCVENDSPFIITVSFTKKDSSEGEGVLQPNTGVAGQACGRGNFMFADDVQGTITTMKPDSTLYFSVKNPSNYEPSFSGWIAGRSKNNPCFGPTYAQEFDSANWDNGILKFTSKRQPDSYNYINWRVIVTQSENPSRDGIARTTCK